MVFGIEAAHANQRDRTGVEEYCFQIIQEFKKIIPADVRVVLYTNEPLRNGLEILPPNWEVKVLRWPFKKLWSQVRLSWEFFRRPPDVYFSPAQILPFIVPKKTVTMIHDCSFLVFPQAFNFWGRHYTKVMNRWVLWRSKLLLTSTEFNRREIARLYPRLLAGKVAVVPLAADREQFTKPATIDLPKLGITKPYIFSVGRLEEKKNTKRMVAAFNILRAKYAIQLVLAGKPRVGYGEVVEAIESSPYKKDIIQLGYAAKTDLPALMQRAQAFIFPSLYEGFGIPLLEAMAAGCPVVASHGSALEEVGGEAALYADPYRVEEIAAQVDRLLTDQTLRETLRAKGRERAVQFSWGLTARETWKNIAKL